LCTLFMPAVEDDPNYKSANLIACKPGLSSQVIVVGAHYDSGLAGKGADDNASGVAVMLEVAEKVQDVQTPYSVCFIAFGDHEPGPMKGGSHYYVEQASDSELKNIVGMINLDSLLAGDITYVHGNPEIRDWILDRAQKDGFNVETLGEDGLFMPNGSPCECSDYGSFEKVGIPFAYFEATNWNLGEKDGWTQFDIKYGEQGKLWHTEYDNLTYIDQTFPGRVDEHLNLFVTLLYETLTQYHK
jgi:alkaline phosphatase isozyme conversion protein